MIITSGLGGGIITQGYGGFLAEILWAVLRLASQITTVAEIRSILWK